MIEFAQSEIGFRLSKATMSLIRAGQVSIELKKITPETLKAREAIKKTLDDFFKQTKTEIVARLMKRVRARKAKTLRKDDNDDVISIDWSTLPPKIQDQLRKAAVEGVTLGFAQLGIDDESLISAVNEVAAAWAADRAAEMVGMKWVDGALVPNPDAKWRIDETTRIELNELVTEAFEKETPINDLARAIEDAGAFKDWRADMIAITETARAQGNGNLEAWQKSEVVEKIGWKTSFDHAEPDECDELADGGPYDLTDVPEYPAHPRCECSLIIVKVKEATA